MKITPTSLSISQLFGTQNEQFIIPAYQRRYAWTWKQVQELHDDIMHLNENDKHLLGSIVCLVGDHKAGINPLELVDGQQRITTLSLYFKAFENRFKDSQDGSVQNQIENLIYCRGVDRVNKNKIQLGDLDDPDYIKIFSGRDYSKIINQNLFAAYNQIKDFINRLSQDQLDLYYFKFINNLLVIRLDVGKERDAYKLFETINNRGLKLNPTDIIKNFLLGHASTIDDETLTIVRENWKNLIIDLDGVDTDDFFRQYMCSVLDRKVTFTYLTDEFKKIYVKNIYEAKNLPEYDIYNKVTIKDESIHGDENGEEEIYNGLQVNNGESKSSITEYSHHLWELAKVYRKITLRKFENPIVNRHLYNLKRIKSFPSYIFLLDLFMREEITDTTKIEILKVIEAFMLRRNICEYRTGELDDIFAKLTQVKSDNIINNVKDRLRKDFPTDKEFADKFSVTSFKGNENRAKYILEQFEYVSRGGTGEMIVPSGWEVHLEHIIPQTIETKKSIKEFGDWITYLGSNAIEGHRQHVNLIGNMTLLGQKLNIAASNDPFKSKLVEYKKSDINLTKHIAENFKTFGFKQVRNRSKSLAEKVCSIWTI